MLKGISPLLSPELLKVLDEMGHGDEIVFADANFPTVSTGKRIVRADGIGAVELLDAVLQPLIPAAQVFQPGFLQLFPLDQYDEDHFVLMEVVPGDPVQTPIWDEYKAVLNRYEPEAKVHTMERFAYYERAKEAYCVVATGETAQYANMILKKGVVR